MEIKEFKFSNSPSKKERFFEVYPLSDDGFSQYLEKTSYVHKFLKVSDSIRVRKNNILNSPNKSDSLEKNNKKIPQNNRINPETAKGSHNSMYSGAVFINGTNFHNGFYSKGLEEDEEKKTEDISKNIFTNPNNFIDKITQDGNNDKNSADEYLSSPIKKEEENLKDKKKQFSEINLKNIFLRKLKNSSKIKVNFYNTTKYKEDYINKVENLKDKIKEKVFPKIDLRNLVKKKYFNGFKSFEIPNLNTKTNSQNYRLNLIRNKLEGTLNNIVGNHNDNLHDRIEKENIKLKGYFDKVNIFSKNNSSSFYPSVGQITNSLNLRTTKISLLNNKFMGEKYDPMNYC